ncbi:MAG TPA: TonB-dependent receptor [Candidatus Methylomirabilis sp.]|nr:TonB-dependent receptor [Candidatus Methylomirabilis sp.]
MRWLVFAMMIGLGCPTLSLAQSVSPQTGTPDVGGAPPPEASQIEPVVVTATMTPTPRERLGAAVTVITGDEITQLNYDRLEDVFRDVPGVQVQTSGSPGKATSLSIRGGGPQRSLFLVDGMRTNSPTLGSTDIAEFTIDSIERIEIVRGPQSTLYGADAISGVVNIITKKGQGAPTASVWVEGGNYDTYREQVNVQGAFHGFNWNVTGSQFNTGGNLPHDDSAQTAFSGRVGYDFPWKGELTLTGRYSDLNLQLPIFSTAPTVLDPNSTNHLETGLYKLAYTQKISDWWNVTASIGQWFNTSTFRDKPPPGTDITNSEINTSRVQGDVLSTFTVPKWNTLSLGWEYRTESGTEANEGTFLSAFSQTLNTLAFFGQDDLALFDRLFLGGGVRWEDNNVFGSSVTGRASAAFVVKETGTKFRFAWGQGFRAPTINDLFFPGFGNTDLKPERSTSWEFGADQQLWQDRIRFGATYFHQNFTDLIQFVFDPTTFLFLPQNVGRARVQGAEVYASFDPVPWMGFYANYTYLNTKDLDTNQELPRVPRNTVNTGVTVTPWSRLSLFMQASVFSDQLESEFAGRNPGYYRIDAGGTYLLVGQWRRLNRLELTVRIQNLTNKKYDEVLGFPALGINALVGLRAYLQ